IQTFRQMSGQRDTIVDLLAIPGGPVGDLPPPEPWAMRERP
ncbi:prevent-host-death protein, partial [Pseudomonas sp. GP01-A5]